MSKNKVNNRSCGTCAYCQSFNEDPFCSVVPMFVFEDIFKNSRACEEYRAITEFEDWLLRIIRNYERKALDCTVDRRIAETEKNYEIKEVVEGILHRYQEILEDEERENVEEETKVWKEYDWEEIRKMLSEYIPRGLIRAEIGMAEDWFYTACNIWSKKKGYEEHIEDPLEDERRKIMGISGSVWATPQIRLIFGDGRRYAKPVYK